MIDDEVVPAGLHVANLSDMKGLPCWLIRAPSGALVYTVHNHPRHLAHAFAASIADSNGWGCAFVQKVGSAGGCEHAKEGDPDDYVKLVRFRGRLRITAQSESEET